MGWRSTRTKTLEAFAAGIIDAFGGHQRFVKRVKEAVDSLTNSRKDLRTVARYYFCVVRTLFELDKLKPPPPPVKDLTDEDLEHELEQGFRKMIDEHPELVFHCAEELGYRVIPPSNGEATIDYQI